MNGQPVPTNANQTVGTTVRAMPAKDGVADGTNTFSMFRRMYSETYTTKTDKKWYGNTANMDASQTAIQRRTMEMGVGSLNATEQPMSFTTPATATTQIRALHRLRNGGATVPAKKTLTPRMF